MNVRSFIHALTPLFESDSVSDALAFFADPEDPLTLAPVVDDANQLIGGIRLEQVQEMPGNMPIQPLITVPVLRIAPDVHIFEAAHLFTKHENHILPVADDDNQFLGLIYRNEVFDYLVRSLAANREGAVLIVEVSKRDYALGPTSLCC